MKMRLKAIFYYWLQIIILSAGSLIFPACQKVINVDLNEAAPKIVIEGLITDKHGPYMLTLSKSGSYFNQPVLQTVTGAQVTITDDKDNVDSLKETAPGVYLTLNTKGFPGIKYTLKVIAENQEYDASSTMPSHVNIDSLRVFKSDAQRINFGGKPRNNPRVEIHCFFKDPVEDCLIGDSIMTKHSNIKMLFCQDFKPKNRHKVKKKFTFSFSLPSYSSSLFLSPPRYL